MPATPHPSAHDNGAGHNGAGPDGADPGGAGPDAGDPGRVDPDVLVVGAGIVGLFCAYFLRLAGASVTVAERGPVGGPQSCSHGNTGFVGTQGSVPLAEPGVPAQGLRWLLNPRSPFYIKPRPDAELIRWLWTFRRYCNEQDAAAGFKVLLDLKKQSLDILRELCQPSENCDPGQPGENGQHAEPGERLGLAAAFTTPGMVLAFKTAQGFDKASKSVPHLVDNGVPVRVLAPGELRALEPGAEFDIHGALYNSEGAALAVPGFLTGFARLLTGLGVQILAETDVTGFEVSGRRVEQVRTTRGALRPGHVVIAAGSWSAQCASKLGLRLRLQPAKGYSITIASSPATPTRPVLLSEGKVALAPVGGQLRIAGTLELSGLDATVSPSRLDGIRQTVRASLPQLDGAPSLQTWCGLRPCTPDGLPFLGHAEPYSNLSVACGHGHIGMGLAPASGKLIAQLITGTQPDTDPAPFRLDRHHRRRAA